MWLFMPFGFYSVVQKPGESDLTIRARVSKDLDSLRIKYMPELGPTKATPRNDYAFRASISHEDFALGLASMARALHYSNVKSETLEISGRMRHDVYASIHDRSCDLNKLEQRES